jgi:hypothetical protein
MTQSLKKCAADLLAILGKEAKILEVTLLDLLLQVVDRHTEMQQRKNDFSCLWTYDLYGPVCNAFDEGKYIPRASGRGLGPGNQDFFEPCEMTSSHQASAIWCIKN